MTFFEAILACLFVGFVFGVLAASSDQENSH